MKQLQLRRGFFFGVFLVSGFSGLIYESIWSHYLKLLLGHAAYAQTAVLVIFMGGMALGAWLAAKYTARWRNLLVTYALVEGITGIFALLFHQVFAGVTQFAFDTAFPALGNAGGINAFKWLLACVLILPQSILLGSTFPLISGGIIRRFTDRPGATLAMLYFTNSLGAALGVLASGFFLIESVGLPGTVRIAGLINVLLALFVWMLARGSPDPAAEAPAPATAAHTHLLRWILGASFCAGVASFAYEIAWIRMLSMVLGSSTHAFELMLSAFILGLAFGGLWIRRRIDTIKDPLMALAWMFGLMAALAALTVPAYGATFNWMSGVLGMFSATPGGYTGFNAVSHLIAAAMMIPTTFVAGMTLPLFTHLLMRRGAGESAIGKVYSLNTLGAIFGALLAVHVLFGLFGVKGTIVAAAVLQLAVALALVWLAGDRQITAPRLAPVFGCGMAVLLIAALVRLDPMQMASGVYRHGQARLPEGSKVSYLRDGKTATISLSERAGIVTIATNGKPDATINMAQGQATADEITMTLAAALPLALHPAAKRVANIGIGSGLTSHVVLTDPGVAVLDSIEIEAAMAQAARRGFGKRVGNLYNDPRSRIHIEDAKTFFVTAGEPYDIIISEPSNPWISGVATLFSDEFYRHVRRFLRDDGLLVQWVQIYETDITVVGSIMKALSPHFADYRIYNTDDANMLIVASKARALTDLDARIFEQPGLAAELARVGIHSLADIQIREIGSKEHLAAMFASLGAPANSDYYPYVDFTAPRMRFLRRDALRLTELRMARIPIQELLGASALPVPGLEHDDLGFLQRVTLSRRAQRIVAAQATGSFVDLDAAATAALLAIGDPKIQCADVGVREVWLGAVTNLANQTTPYLPKSALAPLWRDIAQSPCMAELAADEARFITLLEAVAARDPAKIIATGTALLQSPGIPPDSHQYAVLATASALVAQGDGKAALALIPSLHGPALEAAHLDLAARLLAARAAASFGAQLAEY
jgi:spermidine synthase